MRRLSIGVVLLLSFGGPACAWGDMGHRVICEIAYRVAAPNTRAAIQRLISLDSEFTRFSDSCIWPDHPRRRASEHFVNLPRDARELPKAGCPLAPNCIVTAIENDRAVLASPTASDAEKLAALKYLGHWVGDIHQPMHVSFEDDRGGNNIAVTGQCSRNLHAAWDGCLVSAAVGIDPEAAATALLDAVTTGERERWLTSDPRGWANESFAITTMLTTGYCVRNGESCDRSEAGRLTIDEAYLSANRPVVREQLLKAGLRLGKSLDETLGR